VIATLFAKCMEALLAVIGVGGVGLAIYGSYWLRTTATPTHKQEWHWFRKKAAGTILAVSCFGLLIFTLLATPSGGFSWAELVILPAAFP